MKISSTQIIIVFLCAVGLFEHACSRKDSGSVSGSQRLCRIKATVESATPESADWTSQVQIVVFQNGAYIRNYTNLTAAYGISNVVLNGTLSDSLIKSLRESVTNSGLWSREADLPTFTFVKTLPPQAPPGVLELLEDVSRDNRLCRVTQAVFSRHTGTWTNYGEVLVFRDGTYTHNYTDPWTTNALNALRTTGHLGVAVMNVLALALKDSKDWPTPDGLPSQTIGAEDNRTPYPAGFKWVAKVATENTLRQASNQLGKLNP